MEIDTLAIVQARMGSTRFPGKVLQEVKGQPLIEVLLRRLSLAKRIDKIVVAIPASEDNDVLSRTVRDIGFDVFRGEERDVLSRYYQAARQYTPNLVVRVTGDCPLIDPQLVDLVVDLCKSAGAEFGSNTKPPTYPDGLDVEVFSYEALVRANKEAVELFDREHVTPFIVRTAKGEIVNVTNDHDLSTERWTVDHPEDLVVIRSIIERFHPDITFSWMDVMQLRAFSPASFISNRKIARNEGGQMHTGQKLWTRAKKVIPGGNMLLSKRPEMFLPGGWPTYFSKAKGCTVCDLDGREFIDFSIMGVGTNILGYGNDEVDEVVVRAVTQGNMSTLNCPEEVYLAEKLIEIHPWAHMVRFARTGGEANAIAIRIARAATNKDKIAICGYHGWHDWYLSANLASDQNLDGHLLPGLAPKGVPRSLAGEVLPFRYNQFDELEELVSRHAIGAIKMEVSRNQGPVEGFLEKVRELATSENIVLIFDECTSGFRATFGGLHKAYGIDPDMAIFGKALGNGYAITSVIGTEAVMTAAQDTFISSTFWTERIGSAAGLKTLEVMEREKSWETITKIGEDVTQRWRVLAEKYDLPIRFSGISSLSGFTIDSDNWLQYKTLISQEMLRRGFLASNVLYASIAHNTEVVDWYFENLKPVFAQIRDCEDGREVDSLLEGEPCHSGFRRLN
jgi:glutamate-1-semialdehyde 2,1-aminomutase